MKRDWCKGCRLCVHSCPVKGLAMDKTPNASGSYPACVVHAEKCIACGNCYAVCPDACITVCEDAV
ncbi:MAG: 4Fe-4S binding protein [Treponema sp.]|nr:4Fe-4S binding protein [Treponema sp.]